MILGFVYSLHSKSKTKNRVYAQDWLPSTLKVGYRILRNLAVTWTLNIAYVTDKSHTHLNTVTVAQIFANQTVHY